MTYPSDRYEAMTYARCGASGLRLPRLSLGLWQNFGATTPLETSRALLRRAFERGICHFDLANNYGPPPGQAESLLGRLLTTDFAGYRDELLISTKAGYPMWPGPWGAGGTKKHLTASLDQSLRRLGLDYVDIFYSHRYDGETPAQETAEALAGLVRAGKALYIGISSYNSARTAEVAAALAGLGVPLMLHQPSYSLLNRWIERDGLLDRLQASGTGCIVFSPLAQGMLTEKYLAGDARPGRTSLRPEFLNPENLGRIRALNQIAARRGQSLAQMALAWVLRDPRVTSALIGASRPEQIDDSLGALAGLEFTAEELAEIDLHAQDGGVNLWKASAEL
ncbi:MAG: L-glyceraldehyde 3-phosphate reductase [Rhodobacteraceae bacterium]|jgi:L-glyceraldehyde 3-phosphate reductase|nr:L-glyceraldehyde 3-phosphate reductase [Paracoccaceae bacterium]